MQTTPVLKARLLHAAPGERVVQVSAWQGERCLGSCLGEASNAEEAEQRATTHLLQRLGGSPSAATEEPTPVLSAPARHPVIRQPTAPEAPGDEKATPERQTQSDLFTASPTPVAEELTATPLELTPDPEDWSDELAELDVQLQRIGWDRAQEGAYLQRAFGHPSRNRLTAYADLVSYLRCLRNLPSECDPNSAPVPLRRQDLLAQSEELLQSLRWDAQQGRQLLEQHFQKTSRQQLSDNQLLQFNMLLEEALINHGSGPQPAGLPS